MQSTISPRARMYPHDFLVVTLICSLVCAVLNISSLVFGLVAIICSYKVIINHYYIIITITGAEKQHMAACQIILQHIIKIALFLLGVAI